jgi:hypothetical protein
MATTPVVELSGSLPIPVVAALVSATVSAIISLAISARTLRTQRRQHLENMIDKMIDIAFSYPYLEDDAFCSSWDTMEKSTPEAQRYDNYCCFVFNLLERMWKFQAGNRRKIEEMLHVPEIARRHLKWWKSERTNLAGYNLRFHLYLDDLIGKGA